MAEAADVRVADAIGSLVDQTKTLVAEARKVARLLLEARATAWDEGYTMGWDDGVADATGDDAPPHRRNPYREPVEAGEGDGPAPAG